MISFQNFLIFLKETVFPQTYYWLEFTSVIWVPAILLLVGWSLWTKYVRRAWILKQPKILLEIKLPQETFKTPQAMELVLASLYQTFGESTPFDRYLTGKVRPMLSLEIVSIEGNIFFYIWSFKSQAGGIKAAIYSQYPNVEIHETKDYTEMVNFGHETHAMFGSEFQFGKPDPYPIKTYVDYGMDKPDLDEFYKIDPISPFLELIGTIEKGHQIWLQIILRAHKKEKTIFNSDIDDELPKKAKAEIEKIIEETQTEDDQGRKMPNLVKLTKTRQETITAIERSLDKYPFDAGIRCLYIAEKDKFNPANIGGVLGSLKHFNSGNLNSFKPSNVTNFDYFWQDPFGRRLKFRKTMMFKFYRLRSYFYSPAGRRPIILNTEELATIFHFPGSVVKTPNLRRIPSKRSDAPANLPT